MSEERLKNLETHINMHKKDVSEIKDNIHEIKLLLGGSSLNNNKGFIHLIQVVETKVQNMETELVNIQNDFDNAKFWAKGFIGVGFVTLGFIIKKILSI